MIVPTMTDDDRAFEAFRVTDWLFDFYLDIRDTVAARIKKADRFPYFQRYVLTDDKNNRWVFLFLCRNKAAKRKCLYYTMAYTTYEIPRRYVKEDVNAGKGVIMFDPLAMKAFITAKDEARRASVMDVAPHAFNRYTSRYLKPRGEDGIEFERKLESMLTRWQWFEVAADIYGDENAAKNKTEHSIPYDVYMKGGGMLRGQLYDNLYLRFNTYVSEDLYFDNQLELQEENKKEYIKFQNEEKKKHKMKRNFLRGNLDYI